MCPVKRIFISLALALTLLVIGCNVCSDKFVQRVKSPDGLLTATWYVRNCGATTDFSTIVSIHKTDSSFKDDSDIVFVAKGRGGLHLAWTTRHQLLIQCLGCKRQDIFKEVTKFADIDIMFEYQ
jgi:hypothetical protein